jgi:hypothetical protein
MSDRDRYNDLPEMTANWAVGAGDYNAQRQLDYRLVGGILIQPGEGAPQSESTSGNRKDN